MPPDDTTSSYTTEPSTPHPWWKSAVIYQIYPISFSDSNGDGVGDLQGIRGKLDYLKDLGVDVIWLCPIYRSPLADMGYDMYVLCRLRILRVDKGSNPCSADYRDIDPRYGTLKDWDELLHDVHERGMKLV